MRGALVLPHKYRNRYDRNASGHGNYRCKEPPAEHSSTSPRPQSRKDDFIRDDIASQTQIYLQLQSKDCIVDGE
ncbi:uncharacterized protein PHACADRAFT_253612 [Phanerochaete carnosa HHB-10118-sp]|uniref:Uncharacterized protein n=1 Tax=Phanerochaete carnosa (strain HHB-10118-sp) TaxID=650164 RepID=K5V1U0_PHACS|nr:uncharacterized protein PHACADRAFT_253612 [Phanerochaete carnosa HHB-10118-sp]EKM56471.1 hypothetical protein PHACADRAFT_253612 [Phanerochaete carnosa HHB-10118-sp]